MMDVKEEVVSEEALPVEEPGSLLFSLGYFDVIVLAAIGILCYYYFFKDKKGSDDDYPAFTIAPTEMTSRESDTSFIGKMKTSDRSLVVFYGSQTGTAEEFAGRLVREAQRYGLKGMVADPEECEMEELSKLTEINNSLVIFCMATYGEGDPTDNAQEFYEWLKTTDTDFSGINYAIFGLGNKTYEHFNAMGRFMDTKMEELGANRVYKLGEGDDDANIEEDFMNWKDEFWPAVCQQFGLQVSAEELGVRAHMTIVHDPQEVDHAKVFKGEITRAGAFDKQRGPYDQKNPYLSPVVVNRELFKGGDRSCLHIELDITDSRIRYDAGDHVAVYPVNDSALVNKLGELLEVDLDTIITLTSKDEQSHKKHPFPCPTTYRTALSHYLDIACLPRMHIFKEIAEFTSDDKEKEKLRLMGRNSPEGKSLYNEWVVDSCRNIVQVLEDMSSCKPPIDFLCELLPRLQPRYYSISSSSKMHPSRIAVTATVVKYDTPTNRVNQGVATTYLKKKIVTEEHTPKVPVFVRRSQFRLPARPDVPIIMIGPGTGLAPFRGFMQEREMIQKEGKKLGEAWLFYGCRKRAEQYLYEEELEAFKESGVISKLLVAFSRDQPEKIYVTHLIKDNTEQLWRLLSNGAHLYVCGDAKNMARDVHNLIEKICEEEGGMSSEEAIKFVKKLEQQKRYSADVWS